MAATRKLLNQVFDRERINTIELIHNRKGGSAISVLYRSTKDRPSLKDLDSIGPFYNRKQAEAVAAAHRQTRKCFHGVFSRNIVVQGPSHHAE